MTKDHVASPRAADSVVTPQVKNLTAKSTCSVTVPDWHVKAAPQGSPEQRRRDMCVRGSRSSREPRAGAWGADGSEMIAASPSKGGVLEGGHSACLNLRR